MKICIVSHFAYGALSGGDSGHIGGVERQTALLARWLAGRGHDVGMVTWDEGQRDGSVVDGVRVYRTCRREEGIPGLRFLVPRWSALNAALRRADAQVYYQNCGEYVTGQVALWCRAHRRKFVYSVASDPDCMPSLPLMKTRRERVLYRYGLRNADRVVAQTRNQRRMLEEGFGIGAEVVPMPCPGPGGEEFVPPVPPSGGNGRVLWIGRIDRVKRPDRFLDVVEACPELRFDLVGPAGDAPYSREILERAGRCHNLRVRGAVPRGEVAAHFRNAACLCSTSDVEGFPNTFLEAWSHGVPVVSTIDPDGLILGKGLGAVARTVPELAAALREVASSPERWVGMSVRSRRYFLETHHVPVVMPRMERILLETASPDPGVGIVRDPAAGPPSLRPFPYPFRAMMAVCSDLDGTPDEASYLETIRFLNGTGDTAMGPGLGLEAGNTIYFDMPAGSFSYWNAGEAARERIRELIRSGHIDCLHSFGDGATTRAHAEKALAELERHGCALKVWVDHGTAPTNFGRDIMKGSGDVPGAEAYHADLTFRHGVRYVWMGRVTSVVGQGVPRRWGGLFDAARPLASGKTLLKEGAKGLLAGTVGGKYAMHAGNGLLRDATLRDGRRALEFIRCDPYPGGISARDTADGLGEVLTSRVLDLLEERGGSCILYTHLGKARDRGRPLRGEAAAALRKLAERARDGRILLATTRRLLDYAFARRTLRLRKERVGEWTHVYAEGPAGGEAAAPDGLTVYVRDPERTRLFIDGAEVAGLRRNPPDETGNRSVSAPWVPLRMPGT